MTIQHLLSLPLFGDCQDINSSKQIGKAIFELESIETMQITSRLKQYGENELYPAILHPKCILFRIIVQPNLAKKFPDVQ